MKKRKFQLHKAIYNHRFLRVSLLKDLTTYVLLSNTQAPNLSFVQFNEADLRIKAMKMSLNKAIWFAFRLQVGVDGYDIYQVQCDGKLYPFCFNLRNVINELVRKELSFEWFAWLTRNSNKNTSVQEYWGSIPLLTLSKRHYI